MLDIWKGRPAMTPDENKPTLTDVEKAIKAAKEAEQKIIDLDPPSRLRARDAAGVR